MSKKTKAKQATKQQYQEINKLIEELKAANLSSKNDTHHPKTQSFFDKVKGFWDNFKG